MRKIEKAMCAAVKRMENLNCGNTKVVVVGGCLAHVYLHNNLIAVVDNSLHGKFTLAGWNTTTTRSMLNALGVGVCQRNHVAVYDGVEISSHNLYEF